MNNNGWGEWRLTKNANTVKGDVFTDKVLKSHQLTAGETPASSQPVKRR